ncbi:hypothetical protein BU24DRAFT_487188 [Aaosphaeria arxii CBS 175.79]|uniref:Rhodopsin domain-containing protein n=1 Tax=Aaosphaeria arxii CBS 175.79 TaxID=1450172 RepID=A0A6A5Y4X2_9PLEO|nr:uncharacterized protein BU24DRAFT_487188 [Aaosphaeria arxii CBS 175.79]KAF2020602.1 hypothetical protein BU24DRAFT_487188 [Aaosphaeria arxii CBS 175.79]
MVDVTQELLDGPALEAPPGVTVHLTRTSPEQKWYFVCVPLFTIIPGIFILLRLYTGLKIVRKLGWADYFLLLAFVIFTVSLGLARFTVHYGAGVHLWNLRVSDYIKQLFWLDISEALYCPCIFLIKTAIVLQYLQIFVPSRTGNEVMFYGGWGTIVAMFIFYTVTLLLLFIYNTKGKIRDDYYERRKVTHYDPSIIASAAFNIVSDLVVLLLPVRAVWKLRINAKKKAGIIILFGTGLLATLASGMRILYMIRLLHQGEYRDTSYELARMGLWSWAEIALGIIVACTLSLPKLFRAKSKELSVVLSAVSRPFQSIRSAFGSHVSRAGSRHDGGDDMNDRYSLVRIGTEKREAKTRDFVHAPPGLTIGSDGGSFVMADGASAKDARAEEDNRTLDELERGDVATRWNV